MPRINRQITVDTVRLIDHEGEMIGVVSLSEALQAAEKVGLDLIEISPNVEPPVCKVLDSGKYKYEMQKKKAAAKKNQKVVEVKEVKIRPVTGENDYQVKLRHAKKFLEAGNKVKVTLRFRGREIAHKDLGMKVLERMCEDLKELGKPEATPRIEGKQAIVLLAPL